MLEEQNENQRQRINTIQAAAESYAKNMQGSMGVWSEQLGKLETSLRDLKEKLLGEEQGDVTITGQDLIASAAERAVRLVKEASFSYKTTHLNCSKIGKNVEKSFEEEPISVFKLDINLMNDGAQKNYCNELVHDFAIADGCNSPAETLKEEAVLEKEVLPEPQDLRQLVEEVQLGDIESALATLYKNHPLDEDNLRSDLQTQMVTDCIELDDCNKAIKQLRRFKDEWNDGECQSCRMIGALLVGKASISDSRYKYLFNFASRELLFQKLAVYFKANGAPLKMILRYGSQAMQHLSALGNCGPAGCFYVENELPMEISMSPLHSAFTCPILKEQCSRSNPPMRLVCGHVISKDAINRLTTNLRNVRNTNRAPRFKCPYCPREQLMENAKLVNFYKWAPEEDDTKSEDMDLSN